MDWFDQVFIFKLYIAGFIGSLFAQTITQIKFGTNSAWGVNHGWQNEIAIWNVFAVVILVAIVQKKLQSKLPIVALATLSVGFLLNHLVAYFKKRKLSNLQGSVVNAVGLLVISAWFFAGH